MITQIKISHLSVVALILFTTMFLAALLLPVFAFAATPACGSTITTNTTLDSDMSCNATAIIIGANNITLDCAGRTVTYAKTTAANGISFSGRSGVTVKNCTLVQGSTLSSSRGILGSGSNNLIVSNNITTSGSDASGIQLSAGMNNNLTGNTITTTGFRAKGVLWSGISTSTIAEFNVINTTGEQADGIFFSTAASKITAKNNTINTTGLNARGMLFQNASDNAVSANTITTSGSGSNGFRIEINSNSNSFINNSVVTSGQSAVGTLLSGSINNNLSGNVITTNGSSAFAILVSQASNNSLSQNQITTNGPSSVGILLGHSSNNQISSNKVTTFGLSALGMRFDTSNSNNLITNNEITTNGFGSPAFSLNSSSNNNQLVGNIMEMKGDVNNFTGTLNLCCSDSSTVLNNTVKTRGLNGWGIYLNSMTGTHQVMGNKVETSGNSAHAFYLRLTQAVTASQNSATTTGQSSHALRLENGAHNNTLSSNKLTATGLNSRAIFMTSSATNTLRDNILNSPLPVFVDVSSNAWNIAKTSGMNIVGGPFLGGNFYTNATSNGFSDICADADKDGLCDTVLTHNSTNKDQLPLAFFNPDSEAPATQIALSGTAGQNGWFTSDVSAALTAADNMGGSGVKETRICVDQINVCVPTVGTAVVVTTEGTSYVRYHSLDNNGNLENVKVEQVNIDKTAPVSPTMNALPQFSNLDDQNLTWSESSDVTSGVVGYRLFRCSVTSSALTCMPSDLAASPALTGYVDSSSKAGDTRYFYAVKSVDNAGLESTSSNTVNVTIDKSAPTPPSLSTLSVTGFLNSLPSVLNWSVSQDPGVLASGLNRYNVYKGNLPSLLNLLTTTAPDIRTHSDTNLTEGARAYYQVSATDNAANEGQRSNAESVVLDQTSPVTTLAKNPIVPNGNNGWYKTSFGVTLTCDDPGTGETSGCQAGSTKYSLNNGSLQAYTGALMIDQDGLYTIKYSSADNAGNQETDKNENMQLDATDPVISNNPVASATNNSTLTLSGTVTDATAGVESFTINGQSVSLGSGGSYSYAFTLSEGVNTVTESAIDLAGNTQTVVKQVLLDTQAPATTKTLMDNDGDGFVEGIKLTAADVPKASATTASGVKEIRVRINNGPELTFAGDRVELSLASYSDFNEISIAYFAIDEAGNQEVVNNQSNRADACANVAGQYQGCPFADKTTVTLHLVDQQKSGVCGTLPDGKPRPECKQALSGMLIKIFDREHPDFLETYGTKRPKKDTLNIIYESDLGRVGSCFTGADGSCIAGEDHPGKFLVIAKYEDGDASVYLGKFKNFKRKIIKDFQEEEDDEDEDIASPKDTLITKNLRILKTVKKDGSVSYSAGKMTVVSGSRLDVLYPEYTVWNSNIELYPFVMTSEETWNTDVCLQVPQGYRINSVLDENGNAMPASDCVQQLVAGQPTVILFSVAEIGSPEPDFGLKLTTDHKGKKSKVNFVIEGIRRKTKDKQDQDIVKKVKSLLNKKQKALEDVSSGVSALDQSYDNQKVVTIEFGGSLWSLVRSSLGNLHSDIIKGKTMKLAQYNRINIPEWGLNGGDRDARNLLVGSLIDLTPLWSD